MGSVQMRRWQSILQRSKNGSTLTRGREVDDQGRTTMMTTKKPNLKLRMKSLNAAPRVVEVVDVGAGEGEAGEALRVLLVVPPPGCRSSFRPLWA